MRQESEEVTMRIGLNLLHARPDIGGGWNYIANIVSTLKLLDEDCEFLAYCTNASAEIVPDDTRFKVRIIHLGGSSQIARIAYEQCVLPFLAYWDRVDCMHWFAGNRSMIGLVPSVVTMYDFKFIDRPSEVSFFKWLYLREMSRFSSRWADALTPMSETTAKAAIRLFGVDRKRVFVVPNPIEGTFSRASNATIKEFLERFKLPSQFWLYVAHPYPHKNHSRLFSAYKKFIENRQGAWPLVLRGDRSKDNGMLDRLTREMGIDESIIWLPRLSDKDMATLYSAATAMIFTSLYEGCGIPLLEAMTCGCPMIASDIPTTQEFAGEAALTFDPIKVDEISGAMRRFFEDPQLRASYAAKGIIKAELYTFRNVAARLLTAYRSVVSEK
jgi:glycosyltransferase involved in cell wall biosynthesis